MGVREGTGDPVVWEARTGRIAVPQQSTAHWIHAAALAADRRTLYVATAGRVRLEPLRVHHAEDLFLHCADESVWRYAVERPADLPAMRRLCDAYGAILVVDDSHGHGVMGKTGRGTPVRILALAERGGEAAYAAKTAARVVDLLEDYFAIPYPYAKLDMVTIPITVGFGAMENAGLITYAESIVLMDAKASQERRMHWIGTAAHEIASGNQDLSQRTEVQAGSIEQTTSAMKALTGEIHQVPSAVSAIKVDGVRSYARVRSGQDVELAARPVTIERFDLLCAPRSAPPVVDLDVVVECSSGTYIRALARDLGARLQTAGHLTALRRTAIGTIGIEQCAELGQDPPPVVSAEKVIGDVMPTLQPDADGIDALRNGRRLSLDVPDSTYLVVDSGGSWVSVVSVRDGASHIEVNAPS